MTNDRLEQIKQIRAYGLQAEPTALLLAIDDLLSEQGYIGSDLERAQLERKALGDFAKPRLSGLGAAVSASPQPRCPKCQRNNLLLWPEGHPQQVSCSDCHRTFQCEVISDFYQFFAAAPAQEPRCEYIFRDIGAGLRCDKTSGHDGEHHATMGNIKEGIYVEDPAAQEQPVENSPQRGICKDCGADRSGPSAEAHDEGSPQKGKP